MKQTVQFISGLLCLVCAPLFAKASQPTHSAQLARLDQPALVTYQGALELDNASLKTACLLFSDALVKLGLLIAQPSCVDLSDEQQQEALTHYSLSFSQLGKKLIVRAEKKQPDQASTVRSTSVREVEELDVVLPRIAKALVKNVSLEKTATIDTLSSQEGRRWEKKFGEFLWGLGLLMGGGSLSDTEAGFGANLSFAYEMKHIRLQVDIGGLFDNDMGDNLFQFGVGGAYLPLDSSWSPYLGLRLTYLAMDLGYRGDSEGGQGQGMGTSLFAGLEFFRFHSVRMLVELGLNLPFFDIEMYTGYYETSQYESKYVVAGYGMVSILW